MNYEFTKISSLHFIMYELQNLKFLNYSYGRFLQYNLITDLDFTQNANL